MSKIEDLIPGGAADGKTPKDFDPASLKEGRDHELEHTTNKPLAREIAMDHLEDDEDYYEKLGKMDKSYDEPAQEVSQPPAHQEGQEEQIMQPMLDPYDMNALQSVQQQYNSIGSMNDKDLLKLAQAVWGDGYKYRPISPNQVRAELRGFLQDQVEWLRMNPMAQMLPEMGYVATPQKMPHSSDSSPMYGPGGEDSSDLLNEQNLDGVVSQNERQIGSKNSGF
jgi:hypothetical protein